MKKEWFKSIPCGPLDPVPARAAAGAAALGVAPQDVAGQCEQHEPPAPAPAPAAPLDHAAPPPPAADLAARAVAAAGKEAESRPVSACKGRKATP